MAMAPTLTARPSRHTVSLAVLLVVCGLTPIVSIFFVTGGYLSVDEGVYHMMSRSFAASGGLGIWNGYEEFASPELLLPVARVYEGQLFPAYPYLSTVLAAPFYYVAGYHGLFVLNAIAFLGVVGLCFLTARALLRDVGLALNACLILIFGTFAWQYSQSAWPHVLSMLFVTGAVYCAVWALLQTDRRRALGLGFAAGLVAGFGAGVRLDVIFVLPALVLPFLFVHPWRPLTAVLTCLGTLPGLAVLAATNHAKFGVANPFAYGPASAGAAADIVKYLPVVALGLVATAIAWIATRPRGQAFLQHHRLGATLAVAALVLVICLLPIGRQTVAKLASGAFQLLVDMRIRDPGIAEVALSRGPSGGMVYLGSLKKALLQSCPYLTVLVLPLAALLGRGQDKLAIGAMSLVPAAFIATYSYFAWHGGLAFNLRYFLPIFPFTSILVAYAWREVAHGLPSGWRRGIGIGALAAVCLYLLVVPGGGDFDMAWQETVYLTLPLVIAAVTFLLAVACVLRGGRAGLRLRGAVCAAVAAGTVWAGTVAFTYDAPRAYTFRTERAAFSRRIAPYVEPDSILFVTSWSLFFGLLDLDRVRLARPDYDDYRDFRPLAEFHLAAGRAVYFWLTPAVVETIETRGLFDSFTTVQLYQDPFLGRLVQLRWAAKATDPADSAS